MSKNDTTKVAFALNPMLVLARKEGFYVSEEAKGALQEIVENWYTTCMKNAFRVAQRTGRRTLTKELAEACLR